MNRIFSQTTAVIFELGGILVLSFDNIYFSHYSHHVFSEQKLLIF